MPEPAPDQPQLDPPLEITAFLDRLHQAGQQIVPGSLIWLPHPERAGRLVAGVRVEAVEPVKDAKENDPQRGLRGACGH